MAERFGNRMSGWRGRGRGIPVDHANRDNWQQDYIIPLCSISAKTRLSPPITYWEASQDTDALKGSIDSRQNSVWRNIKFTLNLRTTNVNHYRFLNLHCEPLPPLGYPPDRMSLSLSLEPDREEVMLFRYGKTHAGNSVDLRLFSYGSCRQYTKNSPGSSYRWTAILNNLRDALHQADGIMDLKLILEKEDDMEMLRSFLAAAASYRLDEATDTSRTRVPTEPRAARLRRESRTQFLELVGQRPVVIEHRPPRPQANPNPNPRVYDPFPGIPVPLVRGEQRTWANDGLRPTNDTKVSSESPAGTSHMLAAMALSDGGVGGEGGANEGASLESHEGTVSAEGSSEEWSFLRKKPGDPGQVNSSPSSSSSPSSPLPGAIPIVSRSWERGPLVVQSSSSSSSPVPTPAPSPTVRRRRGPVVVKSESESSDVEIVSSRKLTKVRSKKKKRGRKSAQLGSGEEEKEQETKKKKKRKKRTEFPEPTDEEEAPVHNGECDDDEEMGGEVEEEEPINSDIERRRRKKERKRVRKAKELNNDKDVDNDGDVDMQNYENGSSKRWKKKKPKAAESELDSTSPAAEALPKKSKKHRKGKRKEKPPQSESEELPPLPPLPPLSAKSSSKRKRHDYSTPEVEENDSMGEESSGDISAWKKRLLEINLAKNELYVEERELRARILRKQLTTRKQKAEDGHRFANCTCSACGEYGHRKDSWVCEKHPGRIGR